MGSAEEERAAVVADWAILDDYAYTPVEVIRSTAVTLFYKVWPRDRPEWIERKSLSAFKWRGSEDEARLLSARLTSARAERDRRNREARIWFANECKRLTERGAHLRPDHAGGGV